MKNKLLTVFLVVFCLFLLTSCNTNSVTFEQYESLLVNEKGLVVENVPNAKMTELVEKYLSNIPNISVPSKAMIVGDFTEEIDIDAYLDGTKEFDPEKFANELQGAIIDFGTDLKASVVMGFKQDVLDAIIDSGIELPDDVQIVSKGAYIYIGHTEFINTVYNYVAPTTELAR